ncbi:hypothetical protein J2S24_002353 [Thermoanaerobacter pentosaceus]|uniref:Uncharacterized protein n=1 Tax=Thermoanaerobacter pentosaceus TaxID=694059 RepID=A0ABT9M6T1_9THEO|nr:hypothetical protein [Thermoanaerobacter pentosaceus]
MDDALGIGRHDRIEKGVKIKLVENAIEESYERSSKKTCPEELGKQTVLNAIREVGEVEVKREIVEEKEKIKEVKRYIPNNWEGIVIYNKDEDVIGCSAEGHISHVFSVRLSRKPLGWSREGLKLMAKLRVFSKNGGDLREIEWSNILQYLDTISSRIILDT